MRSLLLSLALLASAGLAALTPNEASAQVIRTYYGPNYYSGYSYAPAYYTPSYYSAGPYYTTSPYGGYAVPYVSSYSMSVYSAPVAPYITYPAVSAYGPIYSGPRYFHGYAPNRAWIYP